MRIPDISRTPTEWLIEAGVPTRYIGGILKSFRSDSVPRVCKYKAPHLFIRFHGKAARSGIYKPNYWADGTALGSSLGRAGQFEGFLTADEIRQIAKTYFREVTAICHNWNDLDSSQFWEIELRGSEEIEGIEGPVAPQPTHAEDSRTGAPASKSELPGGSMQVYLNPRTPFICRPIDW